ncbi:MAG: putative amidohydrolase/GNAT superfamily N-acetyltransferase [Myxococcota bacterium]|jgi:predicted amidohydrolase/GNAT superfamily N-acetyltransferase
MRSRSDFVQRWISGRSHLAWPRFRAHRSPMHDNINDLIVRRLEAADVDAVRDLQSRGFKNLAPWTRRELSAQLVRFPEGQIVIEIDGAIVGSSSSLIVHGDDWERPHTFADVSDNGLIGTHDPEGDTLYGIDIVVDPLYRGMRLARRLYEARQDVCREFGLERMFLAGRMPGYAEHASEMKPRAYLEKVLHKSLFDSVLTSQLSNGFSVLRVLTGYLPEDAQSAGNAVLMQWLNPDYLPPEREDEPGRVRVAAAQYQMRRITSFEEFCNQCEFFLKTASEYRADFLLFPELLTSQLLGLVPAERPGLSARRLTEFTEQFEAFFADAALRYAVNIISTHLTVEDEKLYNIGYLFHRGGGVDRQYKLHITPAEARWWGVEAGDEMRVFDTDCGKVAMLICYDIEFPELSRMARAGGANIFFVPFNTDMRSGYLRVRSCSLARCIENHVYAVLCGAVGNLPQIEAADIHYAQACVLTPSDIPFARDGVAAEATPNTEMMLIHDLDMRMLRRTLRTGTVRPWLDRRTDLYSLKFRGPNGETDV